MTQHENEWKTQFFSWYVLAGLGNACKNFVRQVRYLNETLTLQELKNRLMNMELTAQQEGAGADTATA